MTNRKNNSKTEPSGSVDAIMDEFPDAKLVTGGSYYCECKEKITYALICITCKKPLRPREPEIYVCTCPEDTTCTCGGQN